MNNMRRISAFAAIAASVFLSGCPVTDNPDDPGIAAVGTGFTCGGRAPGGLPTSAFALTTDNRLVNFNPRTLAMIGTAAVAVTGLGAGESLVAMDFRPADGLLVALGRTGTTGAGRLFTVNTSTGAATLIDGPTPPPLTLTGTHFGMDFNPAANRLRIVSDAEENFRVDLTVSPYVVTTDTALSPAGNVVATAYSNNFHQSPVTTMFNIDSSGVVKLQGSVDGVTSPNTGTMTTLGPLGTGPISGEAGFDIDGITGIGLAALTQIGGTSSRIFAVSLATGNGTCYGTIPGGAVIRDLALPTPQPALAFGVNSSNELVSFAPTATGVATVSAALPITGLQTGEQILGIDFRAVDGVLYALGNTSRLYTIAIDPPATPGAATLVGTGPFTPAFAGTAVGFDFNPQADRIRVVSNTGENFRLVPAIVTDPPTAGTVVDFNPLVPGIQYDVALNKVSAGAVAPADEVTGAAHTNNFSAPAPALGAPLTVPAGHPGTTLFVIDSVTDNLLRQGGIGGGTAACTSTTARDANPNCGDLVAIGALGVDTAATVGMDIVGGAAVRANGTNIGDTVTYATLTVGGVPNLYRINLSTGVATQIGTTPIGGAAAPVTLRAFAVRVVR